MAIDNWGVVSGLVALAIGVLATLHLVPSEASAPEQPVAAVSTALVPSPSPETTLVPGVAASIDRVLQQSGDARLANEKELAQLPPTVVSVLVEYGVALKLASLEGAGQ